MNMIQLLDVHQVAEMLSVSIRHIWTLVSKGEFPPPIKIGRASRWDLRDIEEYIAERKAG